MDTQSARDVSDSEKAIFSCEAETRKLLIIGHSHVRCFAEACKVYQWNSVRVVDLLTSNCEAHDLQGVCDFAKSETVDFNPEIVCLLLRGNRHNVLGIVENPVPFAIGDGANGAEPPEANDRHFIPSGLIRDTFESWLEKKLIVALYDTFPSARRVYISPPPPLADFAHIQTYPDIFKSKLSNGPAPDKLRTLLYRTEIKVTKKVSENEGAMFIEPAPHTFDEAGFLHRNLYAPDPTHANSIYGNIMLKHIFKTVHEAR